jgi:hypothetical protein
MARPTESHGEVKEVSVRLDDAIATTWSDSAL